MSGHALTKTRKDRHRRPFPDSKEQLFAFRDQKVAGSNPVTSTKKTALKLLNSGLFLCILHNRSENAPFPYNYFATILKKLKDRKAQDITDLHELVLYLAFCELNALVLFRIGLRPPNNTPKGDISQREYAHQCGEHFTIPAKGNLIWRRYI